MIMKHCTKFQVSAISHLREEESTRFRDRQTDGQTERKVSPRMGGGGEVTVLLRLSLAILFLLLLLLFFFN
jgi:hypothetical protein